MFNFREVSTWQGIISLLTTIAAVRYPEQTQTVIGIGGTIFSAVSAGMPNKVGEKK